MGSLWKTRANIKSHIKGKGELQGRPKAVLASCLVQRESNTHKTSTRDKFNAFLPLKGQLCVGDQKNHHNFVTAWDCGENIAKSK